MVFVRSSRFKKEFKKLPKNIQAKILERLNLLLLTEDKFGPLLNVHKLHGEYGGCCSINITGDFRLIYKKLGDRGFLLLEVGTHSELYE